MICLTWSAAASALVVCLSMSVGEEKCEEPLNDVKMIIQVRQRHIARLIGIIDERVNYSTDEVSSAILALGEYRATEAIPALIKNIDYAIQAPQPGWAVRPLRHPRDVAPSVYALYQIGLPAVAPLVDVMATDGDSQRVYLADWTTSAILGPRLRSVFITDRLEKTKNREEAERLRQYLY